MATREDALEAAKLAAMVGGQLKMLDKMTSTRDNNNPYANKLNMQEFVNKVKNPNASSRAKDYLIKTPKGFAPPPSEDYIKQMIPDIFPQQPLLETSSSTFSPQDIPPDGTLPTNVGSINFSQPMQPVDNILLKNENVITRSDIDSIRNSLKNIDKSLSGLLNFFKNSKLS
jgi:hypothetical protein